MVAAWPACVLLVVAAIAVVAAIRSQRMLKAARREGDKRYEELFNSLIDMVIVYDRAPDGGPGVMLEVNELTCEMTGYSRKELLGQPLDGFVLPVDSAVGMADRGRLLDKGRVLLERQLKTKTGETIPLEVHGNLIPYHGRVATLVICRDISAQRNSEQVLVTAQRLDSLGVLAGGIAHDFNNLLAGLLGHVDLARAAILANDTTAAVDWLNGGLTVFGRAKALTQQLLTFSKGGLPQKRLTDLDTLLRDTVRFVMSGSSLKAELTIPERLWTCAVDPSQIGQALNNILLNAQQAMPQGGTIEIRAQNVPESAAPSLGLAAHPWVKIIVADHGVGIPQESIAHIFDPYFTTKKKGVGLGLATTYSIIKKHDGLIQVDSTPAVGTSFTVFLPALPGAEAIPEPAIESAPRRQGRILVMDDEPFIRTVTPAILDSLGYTAHAAADGQEALNAFNRAREAAAPFDLVILDLTVPGGLGGRETLRRLVEIDPTVKAIASSGYSDDPIMSEPQAFGFLAALRKPYCRDELAQLLLHAL